VVVLVNPSKETAIRNLKQYIGQDLYALAISDGIFVIRNGKQNKGWKGHILEYLAGLPSSSDKRPNGGTYELKSVSFHYSNGILVPKETMAITMINPDELKAYGFYESHCWNKLRSMIFCAVMWHGQHVPKAELLKVVSFNFKENAPLVLEIKADYDFIRAKLISYGFGSLTGKDGKWIQARTKGPGHGSISRAFYARTGLVKLIFDSGT
jgi:DNA mismatch repair protein MutH